MKKEKLYWTTKEGEQLDIDKMDIEHLRNIVKMFVRNRQDIEDMMISDEFNDLYPSMDSGFHMFEDYKL